MNHEARGLGWFDILRLGLVQAALGSVVVLCTSTLNRVMVVEAGLPAVLPGLLVAWHYAVQLMRPAMGHGADVGRRCTPWIVGGIALLATGGVTAAGVTAWAASGEALGALGLAIAVLAFSAIGLGVGACGTSLLALLARTVAPERRAGAAATVWLMMIAGIAVTAGTAGALLEPFSPSRLMAVAGGIGVTAIVVASLAVAGIESRASARGRLQQTEPAGPRVGLVVALREVWADATARRFTIFVFVSMLAYSTQDLILEPYAGAVHGYTPGGSTRLSGVQHGGVLLGMLLATLAGRRIRGRSCGSLGAWTVGGCLASALVLAALSVGGLLQGAAWPLRPTVFALGMANGAFSIAAIGSMMRLAGRSADGREGSRCGTRMGLWGAAQAIAFGLGGLAGTLGSDVARALLGSVAEAYALVFAAEALMFVVAAGLAREVARRRAGTPSLDAPATKARPPTGRERATA